MSTEGSPNKLPVDLSKLEIKPLDRKMDRAAFSCGNARIDNFFRNNARDQHEKHRVRVYVATYDGKIVGYYYLVAQSLPPAHVSEEAIRKFGRVNATPCVYLGMIGTQTEYQNNGIGYVLMLHAMKRTLEVATLVGIYALTLEAIDKPTAERYKKWGFEYFIEGELAMYLPLTTIKEALAPKAEAKPMASEIGPIRVAEAEAIVATSVGPGAEPKSGGGDAGVT